MGLYVLDRRKITCCIGIRSPDPLASSLAATPTTLSRLLAFIIRKLTENFAALKVPRQSSIHLLVKVNVNVGWIQQKALESKEGKISSGLGQLISCVYRHGILYCGFD